MWKHQRRDHIKHAPNLHVGQVHMLVYNKTGIAKVDVDTQLQKPSKQPDTVTM